MIPINRENLIAVAIAVAFVAGLYWGFPVLAEWLMDLFG